MKKKRYGPARNRGYFVPTGGWRKCRDKPTVATLLYTIPAGTVCQWRKLSSTEWLPNKTTKDMVCHGFLWRNRSHYGFAHGEFEIKVAVGKFTSK